MTDGALALRPEELTAVRAILAQHAPDCTAWVFGSRATGKAKPFSDLDLALEGATPLSLDRLAALGEAFAQSDLPWKVDLVDWAAVSPEFRRIIERDRVRF